MHFVTETCHPRKTTDREIVRFRDDRRRPQRTVRIDPTDNMEIDEQSAAGRSQYRGKTYYVCTQSCKDEFDEDPEQYATEAAQVQDNPCREAAETALESTAAILL